jgi:hypothetical protein
LALTTCTIRFNLTVLGHDHMVVGFITTNDISSYHQLTWVRTPNDKVCQWLATGRWFSPGTPQFPPLIKLAHDIAEILLKVMLNTISLNISLKESICPLYLDNCYTFTLVDFVQWASNKTAFVSLPLDKK